MDISCSPAEVVCGPRRWTDSSRTSVCDAEGAGPATMRTCPAGGLTETYLAGFTTTSSYAFTHLSCMSNADAGSTNLSGIFVIGGSILLLVGPDFCSASNC